MQRGQKVGPNGQVRVFNKSGARACFDLCFRGVCLGAGTECFPAIASARPPRRGSCRTQLRSDDDRVGQLRSCRSSAGGQRAGSRDSVFENFGVDPVLGSIAVSRRMYFRTRAACAVGSSGGSSSPLLDVNQAAKPHLFLASPAERPIHLRRFHVPLRQSRRQ
jgi:hypothetical protein